MGALSPVADTLNGPIVSDFPKPLYDDYAVTEAQFRFKLFEYDLRFLQGLNAPLFRQCLPPLELLLKRQLDSGISLL